MLQQKQGPIAYLGAHHPMMRMAFYHHRVPSESGEGKALSFIDFPFMVEPYADAHVVDDMVAQKCTQVGWTEMAMVFMVVLAGVLGRRGAYVMPHEGMVKEFVQDKFAPMLDLTPHYRELAMADWREEPARNVRYRQFGRGSLRFLGSRVKAAFRSFSADAIIVDEVDECDRRYLPMLKDRLRASASPQMIRMGNPSIPGQGISRLYQNSDGRQWLHTCPRCNAHQQLDWFENVVERNDAGQWVPRDRQRADRLRRTRQPAPGPADDIRPVCRRCRRPFARTPFGMWVAQRPSNPRRGYHISQMDVPSRSLWGLYLEFRESLGDPDRMRAFYAGVLGIAYDKGGNRITYSDLQACVRDYPLDHVGGPAYEGKRITMGVDVGAVLNVWISEATDQVVDENEDPEPLRPCRWVGAVASFIELRDIVERYHVDVCVMDHNPERTMAEEFRDWCHANTGCRVWLCSFYLPRKATTRRWGLQLDEASGSVLVGRTALMDSAYADIVQGRRELPEDVFDVLDLQNQMEAPVRKLSDDRTRYIWDEDGKADHYRLADAYDCLAHHLLDTSGGVVEIDLFGDEDEL